MTTRYHRAAAIMSLSPDAMSDIIALVEAKADAMRQWGPKHPHGTGAVAKNWCGKNMTEWLQIQEWVMEEVIAERRMTWAHVLQLKFFQVMAEGDEQAMKQRLLDLAGLAMSWAGDIPDRKTSEHVSETANV